MLTKYLFLALCLFTSCSFPEPSKQESAEEQFRKNRDKAVHHALKKFIKNMEAKGFHAAGIGEGLEHTHDGEKEKQNYLAVTFDIEYLPSIDFARRVEVEALQEFQKYINEEEGIQDYVAEYPYPIKFLNIAFISRHREEGLFLVANCEKEIYYTQDEPHKPGGPSKEIHRESYEEAVCILNQQMNPELNKE